MLQKYAKFGKYESWYIMAGWWMWSAMISYFFILDNSHFGFLCNRKIDTSLWIIYSDFTSTSSILEDSERLDTWRHWERNSGLQYLALG